MTINLEKIYAGLKAWRHERGITAESQKEGYLVNIMEELGELATALREYERFSKPSYPYPKNKKYAEHGIIDALCDISVFTINAGADIPCYNKPTRLELEPCLSLDNLLKEIADHQRCFNSITLCYVLGVCASLCHQYGFDFQKAMDETIKEISSRTGSYDERAKKWVKDTSDEARKKWYKANYELARIEKEKTN